MDKNYLAEAFKSFDLLDEEVFDISLGDGIEKAKEFQEEPVEETEVVVYDTLADSEEELQDSYIGKVILKCEVCQSLLYKNPEDVIISEEEEVANREEVCPFCQSEDGFKVIGQVCEFGKCEEESEEEESEEEPEKEAEEPEEDAESEEEVVEDEEKLEEALSENLVVIKEFSELKPMHRRHAILHRLSDDSYIVALGFDGEKWAQGRYDFESAEEAEEYLRANYPVTEIKEEAEESRLEEKLEEADKPAAVSIEDAQKWVDFDMKRYGKISERTNKLVEKAGFQIIKDDHGDYEVIAGKFEGLKEDFEKVEIETDKEKMSMTSEENGKVVVTTEPKEVAEEVKEEPEAIEPVQPEVEAEFKSEEDVKAEEDEKNASKEDEYLDVDFDEFEEKDFDELGEGYLKRVYENVKAFKTTSGSVDGNNLKLEGIITFKSGKQVKTNFIFEAYKATKSGKLKFIGENKQFAKGKKSFTLTGRADGKKLVCESLNYNYFAKASDGKSKRLYGTIVK